MMFPGMSLTYDTPGALFRQAHSAKLGDNALKSFNRAIHSLSDKGMGGATPTPLEIVSQGAYNDLGREIHKARKAGHQGNLGFVVLSVPNASGHLKTQSP